MLKLFELLLFHEINGAGFMDEMGENLFEKIELDGFVEGVRVGAMASGGQGDPMA